MILSLPSFARGVISVVGLSVNTVFWCSLLLIPAILKVILPLERVTRTLNPLINGIASAWISCNSLGMRAVTATHWQAEGVAALNYNDWYLVNCNHQTWVDIFVLQHVLNGRVPLLKFFLKQQLMYVPVIGLAWWALDFPFLKRHTRAALRKNPDLRNQDRDRARAACAKFSLAPTSVMIFVEGTRFTPEKHAAQSSTYQHLLSPKAGAMAMSLGAMGEQFHSLLDATIAYPDGAPTFWQYLCGQSSRAVVKVRQVEIPNEFCTGDYENDRAMRKTFHRWLEDLWRQKDAELAAMLLTAPQ